MPKSRPPKSKITRYGDPKNPYTKKPMTAAQARAANARNGVRDEPAKPKSSDKKPEKKTLYDRAREHGKRTIQRINDSHGGGARMRAIEKKLKEVGA